MSKVRLGIVLLFLFLAGTLEIYAQVVTPFFVRYQTNDKGTVQLIGNTLMTCPSGGCNGTNNDYNMVYVDIDGDASTINSSEANFTIPVNGSVLWAGLYWSGAPNSGAKDQVKFRAPGASSYTSLSGTVTNSSYGYQGFKDVTALVQSAGSGTYRVADVKSGTGSNKWAGWSLVIVVRDPALPMRNLTVFEGLALVSSSNSTVNINISGFTTPLAGPVNVELGVIAYDGDKSFTGDAMKLNGNTLSNSLNPSSDFFNSSITRLGTAITAKNPNYSNQLGLDIDVINANGLLANGATSAQIKLTTGGESYMPGVVTSVIDLFAPDILTTKSVTDLNGGIAVPGDILEYTVTLVNNGSDGATNVAAVDSIGAYQAFVPGSLRITAGANSGTKSDASGDDQAEYSAGKVYFRLGTGANAVSGGTLAPAATTTFKFKVTVTEPIPDSTSVQNRANISYKSQTIPIRDFTGESTQSAITVTSAADLSLTKTVNTTTPLLDDTLTFTITLNNAGPNIGSGISVTDLLPAGLTFVSATPSQGIYNPGTGLWNIGTVVAPGSAALQVQAKIVSTTSVTNTAEVASSDQKDPDSSPNNGAPGEDDRASVSITPQVTADLAITKRANPLNPNLGDPVTYTVKVYNTGPAAATGIVVDDDLPAGITYVSSSASQGTYNPGTGLWNVGSILNGDSATLTISGTLTVATPVTNMATITASDQNDPDSSDRTDAVTVPQQVADLSISKSVSPTAPAPGDTLTYTIKVFNSGPNSATGITVADTLPAGVSYLYHTATQGSFNDTTAQWQVGTVAVSDSATLQIKTLLNSLGVITNGAKITFAHQSDPDFSDRGDTVSTLVQSADLSLVKTISDSTPSNGSTVVYTLTLSNSGPVTATNVNVTDNLPAGFVVTGITTSQGTFDSTTGVWNVGSVSSGGSAVLTISGIVDYVNFASAAMGLGPATGFNLFVLNDLTQPSADTEGKLAVGRDANLSGYSVGYKLPPSSGTIDVLVVGRNLTYTSGGIWGGNVVYGNTSNLPTGAVTVFDGTVRKDTVIDFAAAKVFLQNLSTTLGSQPINGLVTNDFGKLTLTGADPYYNVFKLPGYELALIHSLEINVPAGSVALVNVDSTGQYWQGGISVNGTTNANVIFNFYQADTMTIFGLDVRGTVLAPFASCNFISGVINGQAIFWNMYGLGQVNLQMFIGDIPVNQNILNTAEVTSTDQYDPDSSPNNNISTEDDQSSAAFHIATNGPTTTGTWQLVGTFPSNEIIQCIAYDVTGNMLMGTLGGKMYRSTNSGLTWGTVNTGFTHAFIWTIAKKGSDLYAGTEGGIYKSTDNGLAWNKVTSYGNYDTRSIVVDTNGVIYAAAWGFGVYKSTNNGATWISVVSDYLYFTITSLAVSDDNILYAGNFGDGVLKSTNGGVTWTNTNMGYNFVWSLACADSGVVIAGSYGNGLFISQDGGGTWTRSVGVPSGAFVNSIAVDSADNKYVATLLSGIYYLDGASAISRPLGLAGYNLNLISRNETTGALFAGTTDGKIYMFTPESTTGIISEDSNLPKEYSLAQNYPNPFNPETVIKFSVPRTVNGTIKLYDVLGSEILTLFSGRMEAGDNQVSFNASKLPSGVYFYRMKAEGFVSTRKMLLIK